MLGTGPVPGCGEQTYQRLKDSDGQLPDGGEEGKAAFSYFYRAVAC